MGTPIIDDDLIDADYEEFLMERMESGEWDSLSPVEQIKLAKEIYLSVLDLNDPNWQKKS